jgi:hypothetical protein
MLWRHLLIKNWINVCGLNIIVNEGKWNNVDGLKIFVNEELKSYWWSEDTCEWRNWYNVDNEE